MRAGATTIATVFSLAVLLQPSPSSATTVNEFMEAATTDPPTPQSELIVTYFQGVLDATMYLGTQMRAFCFPDPLPSRLRLNQEFIADLGQLALEVGREQALSMQVDQALANRWAKRYPCKQP